MRGVYQLSLQTPSGILGGRTLMFAVAPPTKVVEILSAKVTNLDVDTAEQLEAGIFRINAFNSFVVDSSGVAQKSEVGDVDTGVNISGSITDGEPTYNVSPIDRQGFNNLAGYFFDPIPEDRPVIAPGGAIGVRLLTGPATNATTFDVQLNIREIG